MIAHRADNKSCIFCPNEGGAFKKTTTGHWSHLLCAIWIPELTVGNAIYMEPVQDVEQLPKSRWKLVCFFLHITEYS
jgi:NuA3 HAT complex component NTO1